MGTLFILLALALSASLIAGLVKPEWVKQESRKRVAQIFGSTAVIFFIIGGALSPKSPEVPTTATEIGSAVQQVADTSVTAPDQTTTDVAPTPVSVKPSTSKPAPTPTPASTPAPAQQTSPASTQTVSQINAVKKAKSYLGYSAFSHDGLVAQLEYEQFSHADAVYGTDNSGANWNEQAAKKAKSYMDMSAYSRGSLIEQLKYEKFTQAQAEYGANAVGL